MPSTSDNVHQLSDRFVDEYARLDPITATYLGISGHDEELTDYSPDGQQATAESLKAALRAIEATEPSDESESIAKDVFLERIGVESELHDAGEWAAQLNVIDSPVQNTRQVFDLMPSRTTDDWATIAARLANVPEAAAGIRATLGASAARGKVVALRQVTEVAKQCDVWAGVAGEPSFFATLIADAEQAEGMTPALRTDLQAGATAAATAFADLAEYLRSELAPRAPAKDAVGEDAYRLWSRYFTGARLDLVEAYNWGWEEFSRIETEMKQVAREIKSDASPAEAAAILDADPRYVLEGAESLQQWMQRLSDQAVGELRDVHFEIDGPLAELECRIAPPGGGVGAYYTGPTDDFSRPGRMWWSLPAGREEFSTWREVSTVYHEGVPGHHLQIATTVNQAGKLNRFQRLLCGTSGHAEGWALYAERLMRELGYLDDRGDLMGMLDAHLFRAARVIVDIGMHLELTIPAGSGFHEGERWTPQLGLDFMLSRTISDPAAIHDEIDRYLGWPGQAPSYKLGERLWLTARAEAQTRQGPAFSLKQFHKQALEMGSMGLDTLRTRLATL